MKILLVLNSIRVSGSEKLMIALMKELMPRGYEFWIFPLVTPFDEDFKRSVESDGHKLNILLPSSFRRFDQFFWKLNGFTTRLFNWSFREWYLRKFVLRKCAELDIKLAVSNSYTVDLVTVKLGIPFIVIEHGSYSSFIVENKAFDPTPVLESIRVIAVSQWCKQLLESRFPDKKISVIYNAIVPAVRPGNHSLPFKSEPGTFTFCMHGRDTEQKGWDLAIESFLQLKAKGFKARLIMLCAGPYIDTLRDQHKTHKDIIFGGLVYNIEDAMGIIDAGLVLSKRYEAFGLSVLDYFQQGKPVIAGKVGGLPEVVTSDGLTGGIMVDADYGIPRVPEIVDAMQRLIEDKDLYSSLAANGPRIANRFNIKACAAEYDRLFKSLERP